MKLIYKLTLFMNLFMITFQLSAQEYKASSVMLNVADKTKLEQRFKKINVFQFDIFQLYQYVHGKNNVIPLHLKFGTLILDINLSLNDLRSPTCRHQVTTDTGNVYIPLEALNNYAGYIKGSNEAVRMNIYPNRMSAIIYGSDKSYFIESLNQIIPGINSNLVILYTQDDLLPNPNATCGGGTLLPEQLEKENLRLEPKVKGMKKNPSIEKDDIGFTQKKTKGNNSQQYALSVPAAACRKLEIFLDRDWVNLNMYNDTYVTPWCFSNVSGSDFIVAWSNIYDNLNNVEGLYASWGIKFLVVWQHDWATVNDPFTSSTVCGSPDRLAQFRDYWNVNETWIKRDLSICYSGIDFDGSVVGCAYIGAITDATTGNSFVMIQANRWTSTLYDCLTTSSYVNIPNNWAAAEFTCLVGHEIGHIFGCNHDAAGSTTIMAPTVSTASTWSTTSNTVITTNTSSNTNCMSRLATRWLFSPVTATIPVSVYSGEYYLNSTVNAYSSPIQIQGVDLVESQVGTNLVPSSNTNGITLKTGPCQ